MSMKQRVEDLGVLAEKLNNLSDMDICQLYNQRPKDFVEWFHEQPTEEGKGVKTQDDILHEIAYSIRDINDKLCECVVIARGDEE